MKKHLVILVALSLAGCGMFHEPGTGVDTTKAFQATYTVETAGGKGQIHLAGDGAGRLRYDFPWDGSYSSSPQPVSFEASIGAIKMSAQTMGIPGGLVEVLDLNTNEVTDWMKGTGAATRTKLNASASPDLGPQCIVADMLERWAPAKDKSAQPLGAKTINGRACHGWKIKEYAWEHRTSHIGGKETSSTRRIEGKGMQSNWMDDETGVMVEAVADADCMLGGNHFELTEITTQAPDPSVFSPPHAFKSSEGQGSSGFFGNFSMSGTPSDRPSPGNSANMSVSVGQSPSSAQNASPPPVTPPSPRQPEAAPPVDNTPPPRELYDVVAKPGNFLSDKCDYTSSEIDKYMVRFECVSPVKQRPLSFSVVAPREWNSKAVIIHKNDLADISHGYCQLGEIDNEDGTIANTSIEIWFSQFPDDSPPNLQEFVENFCKSLSMTIVEKKESANRIDALVEYDLPKLGKMSARIAFLRHGRQVLWISGCAPKSDFARLANIFSLAAGSFSPEGTSPTLSPEVVSKSMPASVVE